MSSVCDVILYCMHAGEPGEKGEPGIFMYSSYELDKDRIHTYTHTCMHAYIQGSIEVP